MTNQVKSIAQRRRNQRLMRTRIQKASKSRGIFGFEGINYREVERSKFLSTTSPKFTIRIEGPASRDRQLEQACTKLSKEAVDCGILLIRVNHDTFEVAFSPEVPFGLTHELDLL
ncbi:hypothetical protein [Arthrobacter sp. 18067]|uniref:hypothetical protein n=1 Tax=Arthrobacter sp. 18067 TaxID=2681413 RepID=UPI00135C8C19|nr:hypothetical protein [Arthrobacter sp. 18067]